VAFLRLTSASRAVHLLVVVYVAGAATGCHTAGVSATTEKAQSLGSAPAAADVIAVIGWVTGGGLGRIDAVSSAIVAFQHAAADQREASLRTTCVQLKVAASYAQAYAPIPIAGAQRHWALALQELSAASVDCKAGSGSGDASAIVKSVSELETGSTALMAARNAVLAVSPAQ
jgi:hypothetical protein